MIERLEFLIQGSAEDPYRVIIEKHANNLNAFCTCPAGENGQVCKHRLRIFSGNSEGLVSANVEEVASVVDWIVGTDIEIALRKLATAEDEYTRAKKSLDACKKNLAASFRK